MTKDDCDFNTWFDCLRVYLSDEQGLEYRDPAAVLGDYQNGRDLYDVGDEIADEYRY